MQKKIRIIGAGLAGSEAAYFMANAGWLVELYEMRPQKQTPAHKTEGFAELVCSNSLRSDDSSKNAVGLLHEEMEKMGSLIMKSARKTAVPAGGALAVDREKFSAVITETLTHHPNITVIRQEADFPTDDIPTIIATGPLTSDKMADKIKSLTGDESLHFFDAIAPIIYTESINMETAWYQSRYDKGDKYDYLNLPFSKEEYEAFVKALLDGEKMAFKDWEKDTPYFEGCLPVEVMAERGTQTLAFGPMKPVGLRNPHQDNKRPYAVLQLRKENKEGTLMNMVGFQTKLTYPAQKEIFTRFIPGLENAEFARLGGVHRNTFVLGPKVLDERLRLKAYPSVRLAGQVSGCEGYIESATMGLLCAVFCAFPEIPLPPAETAMGALLRHVTQGNPETYQPSNVTFALFPPIRDGKKKDRKNLYSQRAKESFDNWKKEYFS